MLCCDASKKQNKSRVVYPRRWQWKLWSREAVSGRLRLLFCWVPHHTVLEVSATSKSQAQEVLGAGLRIYPEAGTPWDPVKDPVNGHSGEGPGGQTSNNDLRHIKLPPEVPAVEKRLLELFSSAATWRGTPTKSAGAVRWPFPTEIT